MSFPNYPNHKESKIKWVSSIPQHWEIKPLGSICKKIGSGKTPSGGSDVYLNNGILFIRSQNVYDTGLVFDDIAYISDEIDEDLKASRVMHGDILLNITGASIGRTCVVPTSVNNANVNQHVCIIRLNDLKYCPFISNVMKSNLVKSQIEIAQSGAAREGLNFSQISKLKVTFPPLAEQTAIAAFLDRETAKIDALIAEQERLIELLKEKRQAVISHAVTKGLDPNVQLKDSGNEWLGRVPLHWTALRLKTLLFEPLKYGANESAEDDNRSHPRFVRITDIADGGGLRDDTFRSLPPDIAAPYLLQPGDILLARSGATVGKSIICTSEWGPACFAGYLIRVRLRVERCLPDWFAYFCQTHAYREYVNGSLIQATIQNVSAEKYSSLYVPVPPLDEQETIIRRLDSLMVKHVSLVSQAQSAIGLLQERRTALISAAVTGQIDVRGLAPAESL